MKLKLILTTAGVGFGLGPAPTPRRLCLVELATPRRQSSALPGARQWRQERPLGP
jgi:hypothetical protein